MAHRRAPEIPFPLLVDSWPLGSTDQHVIELCSRKMNGGTSLAVQYLRLHVFTMQGAKVQFLVGEIRTVAENTLNITGS